MPAASKEDAADNEEGTTNSESPEEIVAREILTEAPEK